jgi:hypothetical protein
MIAHDGLFFHLKPNSHLGINERYLLHYEDPNDQYPESKHSLLNIRFKSYAT